MRLRLPYYLLALLVVGCAWNAQAQPITRTLATHEDLGFQLRVKQYDEFIDRFNNEDEGLKTLYHQQTGDSLDWRSALALLRGPGIDASMMTRFADSIVAAGRRLDFYDPDWYAEVLCHATHRGQPATLALVLQNETSMPHTSRWVIAAAYADFLVPARQDSVHILDPSNHNVRFVGLHHVFEDGTRLMDHTARDFHPDHLSMLLVAARLGAFTYGGTQAVTFHLLQFDGWIVRVEHVESGEGPSGWLIAALSEATPPQKAAYLSSLLFRP